MKRSRKLISLGSAFIYIPLFYFIAGGCWVLLSHRLLPIYFGRLTSSEESVIDLVFTLITSICLGIFIRRDLTKTKAIQSNEAQLRTLINAVPDYICFKDRKGRIIERNQVAESLFFSADSQENSPIYETSFCGCPNTDEYVWQTEQPLRTEEKLELENGAIKYFDTIKIPVFQAHGTVKGTLVIGRDITDRKKTEQELQVATEELESYINETPDAISIIDLQERVVRVNEASEKIFGWSVEEMLGNQIPSIPEALHQEASFNHRLVLTEQKVITYETKRIKKDGTFIDIVLSLLPIRDGTGMITGIAGVARDITEQKRVERLLRESEAKYRFIAENMSDLIRIFDAKGKTIYSSPSHEQLLGYPIHYFENNDDLMEIHPDDDKLLRQWFELAVQLKNASTMEFRYRHIKGHWITFEATIKPFIGKDQEVEKVILVARDITERRQTEELLRQSDKLSAIGQLAAGIAHEIRNPLTALRGFIQLLHANTAQQNNYCEIMLSELDRINFIVSELLLLAKPQVVKFQNKELSSLLQNVISLLESQAIMNNIQIITHFPAQSLSITCEENQLKQVFINIMKNAIEAMPDGGELRIEMSVYEEGKILIRFIDQGCGIDPERIPKLGEPFYTTKEKGTGLGLMVTYKIIEHHGGSIQIESQPHIGTIVEVMLPVKATVYSG